MPQIISKDSLLYSRYLIGKARHFILQVRQKELKPYLVSARQANVLIILYRLGRKGTLAQLAANTDRGISALSILTTRMEKDGLLKKVRETPKSNQLSFELTKKGLATYEKVKIMSSVKTIMSVLSEEERKQLISSLEKVITKAKQYPWVD